MAELNELINSQKYLEATQLIERTLDYKEKCKLIEQNKHLLLSILNLFPDDLIIRCYYSLFSINQDIIQLPITDYPATLIPIDLLRGILYKSFRFEKMKKDNTPSQSVFPDDLLSVISWNCLISRKEFDRKTTRIYKKEPVNYNEWCYGDNAKFNIFLNEIKMDDFYRENEQHIVDNRNYQAYRANTPYGRLRHFI